MVFRVVYMDRVVMLYSVFIYIENDIDGVKTLTG